MLTAAVQPREINSNLFPWVNDGSQNVSTEAANFCGWVRAENDKVHKMCIKNKIMGYKNQVSL